MIGVDAFIEVPLHSQPDIYSYHAVRYPIRYTATPDPSQTMQQLHCDTDWMGQFKAFLDEGWKLVDICMDSTAIPEGWSVLIFGRDGRRHIDISEPN